jgi:hypothetical protein
MGITICWDNEEKTAIRYVFEGLWDWDELWERSAQIRSMMNTVDHTVHLIIDMSGTSFLPQGTLNYFRVLLNTKHPQTGLTIFVGGNVYTRSLITYHARASEMTFLDVQHVTSLEAARGVISTRCWEFGVLAAV